MAAAPLPGTLGAQSLIVILVNFQDKAQEPYTPGFASSVIFGTTSSFFQENSYGQTWLTGAVYGWLTLAMSYTECDYNKISNLAGQAATSAGANLAAYSRRLYAFPENSCDWWGLGTVGGFPSRAWVNGSLELGVAGHELGHNLGLYHSHALECGTATMAGSCDSIEYGDTLDIMGWGAYHFNAPQKELLGWLGAGASPPMTVVQGTGTYALDTYETATAGVKALKIPRPTGGHFYVELRQPVGFDAGLGGSNVSNGVVVHWENGIDDIYLLDMTPATSSWWDPALGVLTTFTESGVSITPLLVSGGTASVAVDILPPPCVPGAPTVTLSPSGAVWLAPGATAGYTLSLGNNDQGGCGPASFDLVASAPAGWDTTLAQASLTVAPGAVLSTTLALDSPPDGGDGVYPAGVSATRVGGGLGGSASTNLVVASALSVSVTPDSPTYRRFQWVTLSAQVKVGSSPLSGVSVGFTITKPDGKVVTGAGVTDGTGIATYRFRVRFGDKKGIWSVAAAAAAGPVTGSASTSFVVQ